MHDILFSKMHSTDITLLPGSSSLWLFSLGLCILPTIYLAVCTHLQQRMLCASDFCSAVNDCSSCPDCAFLFTSLLAFGLSVFFLTEVTPMMTSLIHSQINDRGRNGYSRGVKTILGAVKHSEFSIIFNK